VGSYGDSSNVYPFGSDPAWKISENELLFFNSMKMKMSVILGITQMIFGICLRGLNCVFFDQWLDFFCDFIPMLLFASSFFGYMIILIFLKWSINWDERMALGSCNYNLAGQFGACTLSDDTPACYSVLGQSCTVNTMVADLCPLDYGGFGDGCQPPNLITTLINIALQPGSVDEPMYAGQTGMQGFLLFVAFISVPWLLIAKPYILKKRADANAHYTVVEGRAQSNPLLDEHREMVFNGANSDEERDGYHGTSSGGGGGDHGGSDDEGHDEDFSEIVIHQAIETIEFVLGMVSNTASYLRLWALSLAHTELAAVFWEKTLVPALQSGNPVLIFVSYSIFASVTCGVLLCMDVLECFLHALRLHWVEFQSKFYKADGVKFKPFLL
jgi:V-type H+-transporting ATPase subunit a